MDDENSRSTAITLQQNEELLTGKKAVELPLNQCAESSDKQVSWNRKDNTKKAQPDYSNTSGEPVVNSPLTVEELTVAMATL